MKESFVTAKAASVMSLTNRMKETASKIVVSEHALMRLHERCGVREDKAQKFVERVWRNGKSVSDFNKRQMNYLAGITEKNDFGRRTAIVFGDDCFIFGTFDPANPKTVGLITTFPLNKDFRKWKRSGNPWSIDGEDDFAAS